MDLESRVEIVETATRLASSLQGAVDFDSLVDFLKTKYPMLEMRSIDSP